MSVRPSEAVANWIKASRAVQPPRTLACFVFVQDGLVNLALPIDMNAFPLNDLIAARDLISKHITQAFENGPVESRANV